MTNSKQMKRSKWTMLVVLMIACLLVVQVGVAQRTANAEDALRSSSMLASAQDPDQFPTSLAAEQTADGDYKFTLTVTNNSGSDITVDQMPIFAQMFLTDYKNINNNVSLNYSHYNLQGKNWDYDPKLFANGQTVEETYVLTRDQMRMDGVIDGYYLFYSVPSLVIQNKYFQLYTVTYEFEIATGDDPSQPDVVSEPREPEEMAMQMISWDINQFETSVQMVTTESGYRFKMNVTNNSGSDLIVDKTPIFSSIMLWDESQQTWHKLRDIARGQEIQPQLFGNGQTITESFELPMDDLQSIVGKNGGKYSFNAVPSLVIGDEVGQLTSASISFTVGTGETSPNDAVDSDTGGNPGTGEPGTGESGSDERPPTDQRTEVQMPAPNAVTGLNFFDLPTAISTETTPTGKRFVMTVTNNSGRDLMLDNLPIFARLVAYDIEKHRWLNLREKSRELKPEMFASGATITETYDMTELKSKYYFYALPSIVINNFSISLMNLTVEVDIKR
jgi:hypothetical protein